MAAAIEVIKMARSFLTLKDATFMNIVRWKLTQLTEAIHTFGYITKKNRLWI